MQYNSHEQLEFEIKNTISYTLAEKMLKCLVIKNRNSYEETHKNLIKIKYIGRYFILFYFIETITISLHILNTIKDLEEVKFGKRNAFLASHLLLILCLFTFSSSIRLDILGCQTTYSMDPRVSCC